MSDDVKKYTSLYDIKDFALNTIGPKYFPEDVIEGYNVGLLGYSLDFMTTTTEDVFNTVPIVANEMFPNLAQMPNSIYNYASLFQEDNLLSTPAVMECILLLPIGYIHRIFNYLKNKKKNNANSSIEIGKKRIELLKKYDLVK